MPHRAALTARDLSHAEKLFYALQGVIMFYRYTQDGEAQRSRDGGRSAGGSSRSSSTKPSKHKSHSRGRPTEELTTVQTLTPSPSFIKALREGVDGGSGSLLTETSAPVRPPTDSVRRLWTELAHIVWRIATLAGGLQKLSLFALVVLDAGEVLAELGRYLLQYVGQTVLTGLPQKRWLPELSALSVEHTLFMLAQLTSRQSCIAMVGGDEAAGGTLFQHLGNEVVSGQHLQWMASVYKCFCDEACRRDASHAYLPSSYFCAVSDVLGIMRSCCEHHSGCSRQMLYAEPMPLVLAMFYGLRLRIAQGRPLRPHEADDGAIRTTFEAHGGSPAQDDDLTDRAEGMLFNVGDLPSLSSGVTVTSAMHVYRAPTQRRTGTPSLSFSNAGLVNSGGLRPGPSAGGWTSVSHASHSPLSHAALSYTGEDISNPTKQKDGGCSSALNQAVLTRSQLQSMMLAGRDSSFDGATQLALDVVVTVLYTTKEINHWSVMPTITTLFSLSSQILTDTESATPVPRSHRVALYENVLNLTELFLAVFQSLHLQDGTSAATNHSDDDLQQLREEVVGKLLQMDFPLQLERIIVASAELVAADPTLLGLVQQLCLLGGQRPGVLPPTSVADDGGLPPRGPNSRADGLSMGNLSFGSNPGGPDMRGGPEYSSPSAVSNKSGVANTSFARSLLKSVLGSRPRKEVEERCVTPRGPPSWLEVPSYLALVRSCVDLLNHVFTKRELSARLRMAAGLLTPAVCCCNVEVFDLLDGRVELRHLLTELLEQAEIFVPSRRAHGSVPHTSSSLVPSPSAMDDVGERHFQTEASIELGSSSLASLSSVESPTYNMDEHRLTMTEFLDVVQLVVGTLESVYVHLGITPTTSELSLLCELPPFFISMDGTSGLGMELEKYFTRVLHLWRCAIHVVEDADLDDRSMEVLLMVLQRAQRRGTLPKDSVRHGRGAPSVQAFPLQPAPRRPLSAQHAIEDSSDAEYTRTMEELSTVFSTLLHRRPASMHPGHLSTLFSIFANHESSLARLGKECIVISFGCREMYTAYAKVLEEGEDLLLTPLLFLFSRYLDSGRLTDEVRHERRVWLHQHGCVKAVLHVLHRYLKAPHASYKFAKVVPQLFHFLSSVEPSQGISPNLQDSRFVDDLCGLLTRLRGTEYYIIVAQSIVDATTNHYEDDRSVTYSTRLIGSFQVPTVNCAAQKLIFLDLIPSIARCIHSRDLGLYHNLMEVVLIVLKCTGNVRSDRLVDFALTHQLSQLLPFLELPANLMDELPFSGSAHNLWAFWYPVLVNSPQRSEWRFSSSGGGVRLTVGRWPADGFTLSTYFRFDAIGPSVPIMDFLPGDLLGCCRGSSSGGGSTSASFLSVSGGDSVHLKRGTERVIVNERHPLQDFSAGKWLHVCVVLSPRHTLTFYLNGFRAGECAHRYYPAELEATVNIGFVDKSISDAWYSIGDIVIWGRELSPAEVEADGAYLDDLPRFPKLQVQDIPRSMATAAGAATASPVSDRLARYVPHAHTHHTILLNVIESGDSVPAFMAKLVGRHATPPTRWVDFHLLWASRGGVQHMLNWMETAPNPAPLEELVHLIAESIRRTILVSTMEPHLYLLLGYRLKQRGAFITKTMCDHLIYLCTSHFAVRGSNTCDGEVHRVIINRLMFEHVLSDVHLYAAMPKDVAMYLLHVMERLFCPSACPYAKRNALFVTPCRLVDPLLHGLASAATKLSVPLREAIVACIKQIVIAVDMEESLVHAVAAQAAILSPMEVAEASSQNTSVQVVLPSMAHAGVELSLRAAGHISVLLLRCLVDFSMHYASFWISFARVVDLPWYIACTSRFADPVSVLYATYLLFTSARHSPALADEVAKHQTIIIEVLRTHATVPELVLLLLALTMGATQHINLLSPQTPLLKQMEYALHGTSPEPDQLVAPIYIKVFLLHLHDTAHKSRFMKEEELLTSVLHRKRREGLLLRRYASLARTCVRLMHAIIHRRYPSALHKRPGPPLPPSRSTSHVLANEDGDTLTGKKGSSRGFASSPGSISSPTSASRAAIMRPRSPAPPPLLLEDVVSSAPTQARFIRSSRYSRAFAVLRVCVLLWIPVQAKRYTWRGAGGVAGSSNKYASTVFCLRTLRRYTSLPSMFHVFTTSPLQTSALSTLVSYISLDLLNPALQRWEEGMEQLCQTRLTPPLITSSTPQGHSHMSEVTESMTTESGPTVVVVGPHGTSSSVDGGERLIMHHGFGSASVGRECETPLTVTTANVGEPCFLHVATTSTTAETMGGGLGDREMSGSYPLVDGAESEPLPAVPATRTPAERVLLARRTASDSRHHHRHHLPSYASSQGDGSRRGAGFVAQESLSHSLPHVVASTMGTSRERDDCVCGGSEGSSSSPGEVGSHGYSSVGGPGSSYFGDQPPRLRVVGSTILFVENLSYVVQTFGDTLRHETVGVLAELIRVSLRTLPVQRWIGGPSYGSCGGLLFQMMLVTSANPSPENNVTNTLIRFFQLHVARAVRDELHSDLAVGEALGRGVNNSTTTTTVGSSTSNITAVSSSTSSSSDVFLFNVIHFTELLVDMVSLSLLNLEATITFLMTLLHLSKRAWQQRYADQLSEQVLRACISVLNRQAMREVSAEVMRCVASLGVLALRPGWMGKGVLESLLFVLLRVYTSAPPAWMSSAEAHLRQRYIIHLLIHLMKVYAGTTELRKALTVRTLTQRISLYEPMTAALLSDVDDHLRSKRFDAFLDANTSAMESLMSSRLKEKAELCYKSCMKARIEYIKRVKAFNELYQSLTELRAGHHPVDLHRCFVGRFSSFVACAPEVEAGQLPWFMLNAYSCEGTSSTTRSQKRRSSERGNGDGEASTVGAHEEEQGAESRFHYMDSERNYAPFVAHGGVGSKDGDATCRCEESCRHVCAIIPSGAGRYWPYMSVDPQPPFMDPRVKLRSSAVSLVRHLLAPEEVLRFISNGFRIHGLHAIPCLVLLTDRSVRLIGYSQVTRSGDIILCQHADSVEGESAELHDADSAVAMLSRHKRRSAFSAFTAMTKQIQRLLLDDPDEAVAQGFRDGSRVAQALKQSSTTKDLKDLFWTYPLMNFRCVRTLRYMHLSTAVEFELYFGDGALISLVDAGQSMNPAVRSEFLSRLSEVLRPHEVPCVDETDRPTAMRSMLVRWAAGSLSNLHYMLFLNEMAGRSRRDLNQYPILPWVLADYSAPSLDFEAAHTFRNLAYPMGAQSEARQCSVREKYANAAEFQASAEDGGSPHQQHHHHGGLGAFGRRTRRQTASVYPFHHGSHYSTSGGVLYYLLRVEPYTTFAKIFQGGELDLPSRLFSSIPASFMSCVNGPTDCKELLPEFYTNAAFLRNADHLALGTTDDGEVVNDVVLPPWAKQSTQVFTAVMRYALECSHTTQHLHQWIDLIFGVRRRGPAAAEALNVFQRMTYGEEVMQALQEARTPHDCDVIIAEVDNFGQTPIQLFQERHPAHHELEPVSNAARSVAASAFAFLSSPTPSINSSKPSSIVGGGAGGNTASSHIYTAAFDHEAHKILGMLLHAHDDPLTHFFLDEVADGILESTNTSADQLAAHFSGRRNPPVMSFCCTRGGKIACSYPRWLAVEGSNTKFGWFEKESRLMRFHCVGGDDDPLQQQQQQQHQHAHQQDCAGGACGGVLRCTSRLAFDSPGESCLRIRAVAVSRCESLVMVGVNSGTIYCLYPDVDGQQVLLHATLNHHTHPILGLVVEPHTSRAISFTCSSTDEPILWRLRPSHSVKMRRLATQSMLTRVSSPATDAHEEDGVVVAACLDKVDGLVVCATARCVCIFDGNGDAFGAGILPGTSKPTAVVTLLDEDGGCGVAVDVPSSREGKEHVRSTTVAKMTSICIYETCEWAAGIRVLVSGHEDGSVSLWRCTRLPPDTVAAGRIAVVEHHAIVGQTRGVHGAVRALHQVKAEVPHFLVGFEDGSVRSMRYEVPDMNANKGEKKSSK